MNSAYYNWSKPDELPRENAINSNPIYSSPLTTLWSTLPVAFFLLMATRLFGVLLNFPGRFAELWRQHSVQESWHQAVLFLTGIFLFAVAHKYYQRAAPAQKKIFIFFGLYLYVVCVFANSYFLQSQYLYLFLKGKLTFSGFYSSIILSLFFEPPYSFFGFVWLAACYYYYSRITKAALSPVISGCLPFFFIPWSCDNLFVAYLIISLFTAIAGCLICQGKSARFLLYTQGFVFCLTLLFLVTRREADTASLLTCFVIFCFLWIPADLTIRQCEKDSHQMATAISWFILSALGAVLHQSIYLAGVGKSIFNLWYMMASLSFGSGVSLALASSLFISCTLGFILPHFASLFFFGLTSFFLLFYLVDGITFHMLGLRISFFTIPWIKGYLYSILTTAISVISWWKLLGLFIAPTLFFSALRFIQSYRRNFILWSAPIIIFMSYASISGVVYRSLLFNYPVLLIEPFRFFLASVPFVKHTDEKSLTSVHDDLRQMGWPLSHYSVIPRISAHKKMNLVLVMLESVNNEYLSLFGYKEPTFTCLEKYRNRMELFPKFFCCFPESSNSDFSLMTGLLPPEHIHVIQKPEHHSATLIETLAKSGYHCAMFSSGYISESGLASFYRPRGLAQLFDPDNLVGISKDDYWQWGISEAAIVERILTYIADYRQKSQQPFFIYYRMAFPHLPYSLDIKTFGYFDESDFLRGSYVGRYKNCLRYIDLQLAKLIEGIERLGLRENTLLVFVGDHGTMLGTTEQQGQIGHGFNLYPNLTNVPFFIVYPEERGLIINPVLCSHADILPTLLPQIGWSGTFESLVQGRDLKASSVPIIPLYLASLSPQRGLIDGDTYFVFPNAETADAYVYRMHLNGYRLEFSQLQTWNVQDLQKKHRDANRFARTQQKLLLHFETFLAHKKNNPNSLGASR